MAQNIRTSLVRLLPLAGSSRASAVAGHHTRAFYSAASYANATHWKVLLKLPLVLNVSNLGLIPEVGVVKDQVLRGLLLGVASMETGEEVIAVMDGLFIDTQ